MAKRNSVAALVAASVGLALLAGISGCGTAEAKPLEVTYYYLPG